MVQFFDSQCIWQCKALNGSRSLSILVTSPNRVSRLFLIFWTGDFSCCNILRRVSSLDPSLKFLHITMSLTKPFQHWRLFVHLLSSNTNIMIHIPAPILQSFHTISPQLCLRCCATSIFYSVCLQSLMLNRFFFHVFRALPISCDDIFQIYKLVNLFKLPSFNY